MSETATTAETAVGSSLGPDPPEKRASETSLRVACAALSAAIVMLLRRAEELAPGVAGMDAMHVQSILWPYVMSSYGGRLLAAREIRRAVEAVVWATGAALGLWADATTTTRPRSLRSLSWMLERLAPELGVAASAGLQYVKDVGNEAVHAVVSPPEMDTRQMHRLLVATHEGLAVLVQLLAGAAKVILVSAAPPAPPLCAVASALLAKRARN